MQEQCTLNENVKKVEIKTEQPEAVDGSNNFLSSMSISNSLNQCCPLEYQPQQSRVLHLEGLHLTLAPCAAKFLVLAIRDRIRHGRHFTFKCQNMAITFVSESVSGSVVTKANPFGVLGYWMQVCRKI